MPLSLLVAMPVAVNNGKAYVAAKEARQMQAARQAQEQAGAGATAPRGAE